MIDVYELQQKKCLKLYIGEQKKYFMLCHEQKSANDQKRIVLRSPLQVRNALKIPMEIKLELDIGDDSQQEEAKMGSNQLMRKASDFSSFRLHLDPDSSTIIPMKMMLFECFRIRPLSLKGKNNSNTGEDYDIARFEDEDLYGWSNSA